MRGLILKIAACDPPADSLIQPYRDADEYTDCFTCSVATAVTLPAYIKAFYGSRVFWTERQGLKLLLGKPGSREDIAALSEGSADTFSAWTVEAREADQILLKDFQGNTLSWLRVTPVEGGSALYLGTVIIKKAVSKDGEKQLKPGFSALMGFHNAYSKALLKAAARAV